MRRNGRERRVLQLARRAPEAGPLELVRNHSRRVQQHRVRSQEPRQLLAPREPQTRRESLPRHMLLRLGRVRSSGRASQPHKVRLVQDWRLERPERHVSSDAHSSRASILLSHP